MAETIKTGDTFTDENALGKVEYRVLRPHERDAGHWLCVFNRWLTEVPAFRQGFVGSIEVRSTSDIRKLRDHAALALAEGKQ